MNRWLRVPLLLLPIAACNQSQQLQGSSTPDASPLGRDAAGPLVDGSISLGDAGLDANPPGNANPGDASSGRPISTCVPQPQQGTMSILMDGSQPYITDVDDIAFGSADVYAFSIPFGLYGTPLLGGAVQELSPTASLPSLIAAAVAPPGSALGGAVSSEGVLTTDLPTGQGTFLGLRGPAGGEVGVPRGQIAVDGTDVFFWTESPSQLVQASLAGAPDRIVASYPPSSTTVTAVAFDPTYLYFATSDAIVHRTLRSGGSVDDLATMIDPVDSILVDGGTLYLAQARTGGTGHADFNMWSYDIASAMTTASVYFPLLIARTTPVTFDGTAFYWGASSGDVTCGGVLMLLSASAFSTQGAPETLVQNLDIPLVVRLSNGNAYMGTAGDATYRTPLTDGQLLLWKP
jgi:hypothetical protein